MRHSSALLNYITVIISLALMFIAVSFPDFASFAALWIVLFSILIIGIPHGAIDHIMAAELYNLNQTLKDHLLFYSSYLLIMLVIAALWYFIPIAGMILFLAISIYHFGQADMEDFLENSGMPYFWYLIRGTLIIGLIIFSDPDVTYPIMSAAMQIDPAAFNDFMPDQLISISLISVFYALPVLFGVATGKINRGIHFIADSLLLAAVLMITGPLIGFALYFALWHSVGHLAEMQRYFARNQKSLSVKEFYIKAAPFTLVSIFGLLILAGINQAFGLQEQFLSLMFILISVLTLPHMFIVDRMYSAK